MLTSPYKGKLAPGVSPHPITCRVDPKDAIYLRRLFPMRTGVIDTAMAILFHKLITALKASGLDPNNTDHQAYAFDHPSNIVLDNILERFNVQEPTAPKKPRKSKPNGQPTKP